MLSLEIEAKLKKVKNFLGVFSRDTLPRIKSYPSCLVANIDTHDLEGSHWIAIYIDKSGKAEYFDSYGLPPINIEFLNFFEQYSKGFTWNKISLQCLTCITCGHYCVAYILSRSCGKSHRDFIQLFTDNKLNNDIIIKEIFKVL